MANGNLEKLIVDFKDSLEREIFELGREMRQGFTDLRERFDRQDARLTRHGGLLQSGARQITRLVEWTEAADDQSAKRDARLMELEKRVNELERRLGESR